MSLHPIDKNGNYTEEQLDKFLVFCLLDRAMPYEQVCKIFQWLDYIGLTTRTGIKASGYGPKELANALSCEGTKHRFPNQTAKFIYAFSLSNVDLRNASREELMEKLPGLGYKLASMFLRNTRKEDYAVIDTHIKRWMEQRGFNPNAPYKDLEKAFLYIARGMGKTAYQLDMEIWQENRVGNRRKKKNGS